MLTYEDVGIAFPHIISSGLYWIFIGNECPHLILTRILYFPTPYMHSFFLQRNNFLATGEKSEIPIPALYTETYINERPIAGDYELQPWPWNASAGP